MTRAERHQYIRKMLRDSLAQINVCLAWHEREPLHLPDQDEEVRFCLSDAHMGIEIAQTLFERYGEK